MTATTALGRARAAARRGDTDEALRLVLALVGESDAHLSGYSLMAEVLVGRERTVVAVDALERLVDHYASLGALGAALQCARLLGEAGGDAAAATKRLAGRFADGSAELDASARVAPPIEVPPIEVPEILAKTSGEALLDRAEDALDAWLAGRASQPPSGGLPRLPLFSDLAAEHLAALLGAAEVRPVDLGGAVIQEGAPGEHAFVVARGRLAVTRGEGDEAKTLAELRRGALFGEMALVSRAPRAASVSASEPSVVLAFARADLEALAAETPVLGQALARFCRGRMVSNLVRHGAILRALGEDERNALIGLFETVTFEPRDRLVTEGQEGAGLFLIASGEVEVRSKDADGEAIQVAVLGPGDVVGEISLVLRRPANATVVALHPTVALRLEPSAFQDAIRAHGGLLTELYELATRRDEETRSVVAQETFDVDEAILL